MKITEEQYARIKDSLPVQRGNVSLTNLQVLNAILYVAEQGCKWRSFRNIDPGSAHLSAIFLLDLVRDCERRHSTNRTIVISMLRWVDTQHQPQLVAQQSKEFFSFLRVSLNAEVIKARQAGLIQDGAMQPLFECAAEIIQGIAECSHSGQLSHAHRSTEFGAFHKAAIRFLHGLARPIRAFRKFELIWNFEASPSRAE